MRLRIFRGKSMSEAMAEIRTVLGDSALILSTQSFRDRSVEITTALDDDDGLDLFTQSGVSAPIVHSPALDFSSVLPMSSELSPESLMTWHGIPAHVLHRMGTGALERELPKIINFGPMDLNHDSTPVLMCGPCGGGKTLTVARLATRMVMTGTQPLVITTDNSRAGAVEQLAAYTRLLGLPLISADRPEIVVRAMRHRRGGQPVLVDTAGIDPFCSRSMEKLEELRDACNGRLALVLSAGLDARESEEIGDAFLGMGAANLVATRLDQARRFGGIVAAGAVGLTLSEAGIGSAAAGGMTAMTPTLLAEHLRRARKHTVEPAPLDVVPPATGSPGWPSPGATSAAHQPSALSLHIAAQQRS